MDFIIIYINSFRFLIYNNDFLLNSNSTNPPFSSVVLCINKMIKKKHIKAHWCVFHAGFRFGNLQRKRECYAAE